MSDSDEGTARGGHAFRTALWVYKFHCLGQLFLLGYTREDAVRLISLEAIGPHENFYRDLKRG